MIAAFCAASALFICCVFATAGVRKLARPADHARIVDAYALLPAGAGRLLVLPLGVLECAAAIALLFPVHREGAALVVLALLGFYSGAIAINLLRGNTEIDCGCAGMRGPRTLSAWLIARNAVLAGCAVLVARISDPAHDAMPFSALPIAAVALLLYNAGEFILSRDALLDDD